MSYFTPPPSGNWNGSMPFGQSQGANGQGSQHPQFTQLPHSQQNMPNPMLMMMTMYQQMQNVAPPAPRSHLPTPAAEAHKTTVPMDEQKLASVLFQQTALGMSYKAAIETMHGFDGYAAYAWKDFYLEHKPTVDLLVEEHRILANHSSSNNRLHRNDLKREFSASVSSDAKGSAEPPAQRKKAKESSIPPKASKEKEKTKAQKSEDISISSMRRKTLNSLSVAPSDNLLSNVPSAVAIDSYTGLPAAPPQRPVAPSAAISKTSRGRGNAYTEEDTIFFYQLTAWEIANNPNATKGSICDLLSEMAPQRSALSWRTFWQRHEDVADKMLMLSELSEADREERIRTWKKDGTVASTSSGRSVKKVSYAESSSDSEEEEKSEYESPEEDNSEDVGEEEDDAIGSTDEEGVLGASGSPFTQAELRVLAKHVASVPGWFEGQKDWSGFVEKYNQRTAASWREYYRRKQKEVDEAARKYMKRAKRAAQSNSVHQQRGRPSWASSGSGRPPSSDGRKKRKHADEYSEDGSKRAKSDDTE